jgi:hypothetical protein
MRALAALAFALLAAGACDRGTDSRGAPGSVAGAAQAPDPAGAGAPAGDLATVPPGGASIRFADGRVHVVSRGARLDRVLDELGRAAGFVVDGSSPRTDRSVEIELHDAPLEVALSNLLDGSDWGAEYVTREKGHRLVRVRLGPAAEPAAGEAGPRASEPAPGADEELVHPAQELEEARSAPLPAPVDEEREQAELEAALASPDAVRRAEAVEGLDYSYAEDFERLLRFARDDPDPAVRLAAVETLDGDTSYGALKALVGALGDPDPEVVVRAIEALAGYEDETVAPELEPLREHRDPAVRDAADEALQSLEE